LNKSIVLINYFAEISIPAYAAVLAGFNSSSQLQFERSQPHSFGTVRVMWQVVEFTNSKSKQIGRVVVSSAGTNVSINAVDISKSVLIVSFKHPEGNAAHATLEARILNETTLYFQSSSGSPTVEWQLIEFE